MSIETDIPELLFSHMAAFDPNIQIAFPNVEFTPPQEIYLEVRFLPNDNRNVYVGNNDPAIYIGFLQITVVAPSAIGEIHPRNLAAQIVEHFGKGTRLQRDNTIIKIYAKPSVATMMQDVDRVRIPVSIPYQSSG